MVPEWLRAAVAISMVAIGMWAIICFMIGRIPRNPAVRSVMFVVLTVFVLGGVVRTLTGWKALAIWPENEEYARQLADWAEGR